MGRGPGSWGAGSLGTTIPRGQLQPFGENPERDSPGFGRLSLDLLPLNWLQGPDNARNCRLMALGDKLQMNVTGQGAGMEKIHPAKQTQGQKGECSPV